MPKLAIFVHDLSATGVVRNALAVARHMKVVGWNVTLVVCRNEGDLAVDAKGIDLLVLRPGKRGSVPRSLDLLGNVLRLRRALMSLQPDTCMSAGNHSHLSCWLAARGSAEPSVVYRISNDLNHGQPARGICGRRIATRLFVHHSARMVLVSPTLASDPSLSHALISGKAVVIANGVDIDDARHRAFDPDFALPWAQQDDPIVLAVGRFVKQKNFGTLIQAAALAHARLPLRLVILGSGSDAERANLLSQAEACGIGDRLHMPGVCGNPFAAMRRAALVVVPSLWEGAPNVLLEAMAVGTPVVAAHTAGNASAVLDSGRYGLLVDPLDASAMAEAMLRQLDPSRRVMPGDRARDYDRRHSLESYRQVLQSLVPQTCPEAG